MNENLLKRIVIDNFRGLKHFDSAIGDELTVIVGDNATGKSTIFAAFTWCLFGKDELDRKDYEIKPCVAGQSTRVDVSVEIHLMTNNHTHLLKRVFREKWVRHKNEVEETFEGNETLCFWDDAPVSVTEYKKRVADIVDESLFKMLTNPYYFPTMKWQEMRAALFNIVPAVSDEDVAKKDAEFKALLDTLNGESLRDFKARIARALKTLRKESAEIQPRIDEVLRGIPETTETRESIAKRTVEITAQIENIDKQLQSTTESVAAYAKSLSEKRQQLLKLSAEVDKLVSDAQLAERERVSKANTEYDMLKQNIDVIRRQLTGDKNYLDSYQKQTERLVVERDRIAQQKEELKAEYFAVDAKTYDGSDICPTCGQTLPEAMRKDAEANFNSTKQRQLDDITKRGLALKQQLEERDAEIERRKNEALNLAAKYDDLQTELEDKEKCLSQILQVHEETIDVNSIDGYSEAVKRVEDFKEELRALEASDDRDTETEMRLESERAKLRDEYSALQREKSIIELRESAENRVEELEKRGRELAQQIADYEKQVFVATKFEQAKVEDLEEHVNAMFHSVKWRLFDYTLDGNVVETCVPIVGDALYPVANSAAKINAGLDIIHTLSEHYGVRCPIFIDNAESITNIESYDLQLITLYVERGAFLKVCTIK